MLRRLVILLIPAFAAILSPLAAQPRPAGETYYRHYWLDAFDRFVFADTLKAPEDGVESVGVARDSLGRIKRITRYWYGNIDTKAPWAMMQITHIASDTGGLRAERREYQLVNERPIAIGKIASVVLRYRADGTLLTRGTFDLERKPVDDANYIGGTLIRPLGDSSYMQEWFVSTGKQQRGWHSDPEKSPFGELPYDAWFRRFTVDSHGWLTSEEVMGFDKRPLPYPGGEMGRRYEYDESGRVLRLRLVDRNGDAMEDAVGVAAEEFEYDSLGRVSISRTLDSGGHLHARKADGVAELRYTYHPFSGHVTKVVRINNHGEVIQ